MDKSEFKKLLENMDVYDKNQQANLVQELKHNICQNLRIARNLCKMSTEEASQYFGIEPQSLRRIEAENDRDDFSSKVLIMAIMLYNQDANFYFKNWKVNELLLKK